MQYRTFGNLNIKVSALGFGCMRFPTTDGKPLSANIDEPEATRMLRYAIDRGVNYVDTAYPYHQQNSERVVGRALKDGYREKVYLASKLPVWLVKETADFDKFLNEQLEKLQTDHIDFYLMHSLDQGAWEKIINLKLLQRAEAALADGRIRHLGFSFHDAFPAFKQIVDGYDRWSFCQIQYNYMDINNQAGTAGLQYAASKGLGVVVMEPLLGGRLANPPQSIRDIWSRTDKKRSPADWALQWLWNQPEVSLLLSGMSNMPQVEENLASAELSGAGTFSAEEENLIEQARLMYSELSPIPCTKCNYCMPCPNGVNIPRNFEIFNGGVMYSDPVGSRTEYNAFLGASERASQCVECRVCEEKCPQKIEISQWMPLIQQVLGEGKPYKNSYPQIP